MAAPNGAEKVAEAVADGAEVLTCCMTEKYFFVLSLSKVSLPRRLAKDSAQPSVARWFWGEFLKIKSLLAVYQQVARSRNQLVLGKHHLKRRWRRCFRAGVGEFFFEKMADEPTTYAPKVMG